MPIAYNPYIYVCIFYRVKEGEAGAIVGKVSADDKDSKVKQV